MVWFRAPHWSNTLRWSPARTRKTVTLTSCVCAWQPREPQSLHRGRRWQCMRNLQARLQQHRPLFSWLEHSGGWAVLLPPTNSRSRFSLELEKRLVPVDPRLLFQCEIAVQLGCYQGNNKYSCACGRCSRCTMDFSRIQYTLATFSASGLLSELPLDRPHHAAAAAAASPHPFPFLSFALCWS